MEIIEKCRLLKQASANKINQEEKDDPLEINIQIEKWWDKINELKKKLA